MNSGHGDTLDQLYSLNIILLYTAHFLRHKVIVAEQQKWSHVEVTQQLMRFFGEIQKENIEFNYC